MAYTPSEFEKSLQKYERDVKLAATGKIHFAKMMQMRQEIQDLFNLLEQDRNRLVVLTEKERKWKKQEGPHTLPEAKELQALRERRELRLMGENNYHIARGKLEGHLKTIDQVEQVAYQKSSQGDPLGAARYIHENRQDKKRDKQVRKVNAMVKNEQRDRIQAQQDSDRRNAIQESAARRDNIAEATRLAEIGRQERVQEYQALQAAKAREKGQKKLQDNENRFGKKFEDRFLKHGSLQKAFAEKKKTMWKFRTYNKERDKQIQFLESVKDELSKNIDISPTQKAHVLYAAMDLVYHDLKAEHDTKRSSWFGSKSRLEVLLENEMSDLNQIYKKDIHNTAAGVSLDDSLKTLDSPHDLTGHKKKLAELVADKPALEGSFKKFSQHVADLEQRRADLNKPKHKH